MGGTGWDAGTTTRKAGGSNGRTMKGTEAVGMAAGLETGAPGMGGEIWAPKVGSPSTAEGGAEGPGMGGKETGAPCPGRGRAGAPGMGREEPDTPCSGRGGAGAPAWVGQSLTPTALEEEALEPPAWVV